MRPWLLELAGAAALCAGICMSFGVAAMLVALGVMFVLKAFEIEGRAP